MFWKQNLMANVTKQPSTAQRLRIALIYRYGVHDHEELYPIIPKVLKQLGALCDVVYVGPNRQKGEGQYQFPGVRYLFVPFRVNRARTMDKVIKALLWYAWLPWLALYLRWFWRADLIWIDESSLPAQAWLVQWFSGRPVAVTVADFFLNIYSEHFVGLRPWVSLFNAIDLPELVQGRRTVHPNGQSPTAVDLGGRITRACADYARCCLAGFVHARRGPGGAPPVGLLSRGCGTLPPWHFASQ